MIQNGFLTTPRGWAIRFTGVFKNHNDPDAARVTAGKLDVDQDPQRLVKGECAFAPDGSSEPRRARLVLVHDHVVLGCDPDWQNWTWSELLGHAILFDQWGFHGLLRRYLKLVRVSTFACRYHAGDFWTQLHGCLGRLDKVKSKVVYLRKNTFILEPRCDQLALVATFSSNTASTLQARIHR